MNLAGLTLCTLSVYNSFPFDFEMQSDLSLCVCRIIVCLLLQKEVFLEKLHVGLYCLQKQTTNKQTTTEQVAFNRLSALIFKLQRLLFVYCGIRAFCLFWMR